MPDFPLFYPDMGNDSSKSKGDSEKCRDLPAIQLTSSCTYYDGMYKKSSTSPDASPRRTRGGSASSRSSAKHAVSLKHRRLIQSCFLNPHEMIGRRIMKRSAEIRSDFNTFYCTLDNEHREEMEENMKMLLKKVVTNIDFLDEVQRLSEEFGAKFADLRSYGFKPDYFAVIADATIKECTNLDSAVHKAHTTTEAFSTFGAMIFSSVRDGFYTQIRFLRRASNSFSTGSNSSQRKKKRSVDSSGISSRGNSPRTSFSRCSPRSVSPESRISDEFSTVSIEDDGFLKPPQMSVVPTRSY